MTEYELTERIHALEREWDVERVLAAKASLIAAAGLILSAKRDKRWLLLPGIALPFLFLQAVQGWSPPMPVLRRFGIRTRKEIEREKYALKILRGDFRGIEQPD